ncbi:MAG: hypothetical protein AB2598_08035 [Candidatus Thiodiazotropha sp.]
MHPWQITTICIALLSPLFCQAETHLEHRSNRQLAVTVCNDYRVTNRLPCFVSRNDCPSGFEVIEHFSDNRGPAFSACRDKRHERPRPTHSLYAGKNPQLLKQFDRLLSEIEKRQVGKLIRLPKASQEKLRIFFTAIDLNTIELGHSKALQKGCFTDCRKIFCARGGEIDAWADPQRPLLSKTLLHQLAQAERCEIQGGRDRFLLAWLKHLPDDIFDALDRGEAIDTKMIRYATYLEGHATNRAESICRRVRCE